MNPLYNITNQNFLANLSRQAMELKKTVSNPRQMVEEMLNSGAITQQEFNQVFPFAVQMGNMMSQKRL